MKERPILFSGPMVHALLNGTKTQTRGLVKPQPERRHIEQVGSMLGFKKRHGDGFWLWPNAKERILAECPYGQLGERLWVRESFWGCDLPGYGDQPCVVYEDEWHGKEYRPAVPRPWARKFGHIPGIHMPRDASRITLEIVSVRVERLQDISETDAMAEGVDMEQMVTMPMFPGSPVTVSLKPRNAIEAYAALWESINGPGSWDANPWVWVVEFKRIIT